MGKSKKARRSQWGKFLITILIMLIITAGTLVGLYFYMQFLLAQNEREGFSEDDMIVPLREEWNYPQEDPPLFIGSGPVPAFSCKLLWPINGTAGLLDGYEGIGAVLNLTLMNEGMSMIYIERVEFQTGWGLEDSIEIGRYVKPRSRRYIGHMMMDIPVPAPPEDELAYEIKIDLLVEGANQWVRKKGMEFDSSMINLIPIAGKVDAPEYRFNRPYYYDIINDLVEEDMDEISDLVVEEGLDDGVFTIQDLVDAQSFVYESLEYISDPDTGENEWISPMTTLERGGGDCEDYSILLGAIITSLGGNARVIITSNHAFTSVFIGDDDSILDDINDRFSMDIPFQIMEDDLGLWLIIEPQSFLVFGWFPTDIQVQMDPQPDAYIYNNDVIEWAYADSDIIYIVDIYFL